RAAVFDIWTAVPAAWQRWRAHRSAAARPGAAAPGHRHDPGPVRPGSAPGRPQPGRGADAVPAHWPVQALPGPDSALVPDPGSPGARLPFPAAGDAYCAGRRGHGLLRPKRADQALQAMLRNHAAAVCQGGRRRGGPLAIWQRSGHGRITAGSQPDNGLAAAPSRALRNFCQYAVPAFADPPRTLITVQEVGMATPAMCKQAGPPRAQLRRALGLRGAVALGVGGTIGGGIFVLVGHTAALAGPAALLAFGLAFIASLLIALPYAE